MSRYSYGKTAGFHIIVSFIVLWLIMHGFKCKVAKFHLELILTVLCYQYYKAEKCPFPFAQNRKLTENPTCCEVSKLN